MVVGGFGSRIRKARYAPHIERCLEEFVSEVPERKIEILQELSELVIDSLVASYLEDILEFTVDSSPLVRHQCLTLLSELFDRDSEAFDKYMVDIASIAKDEHTHSRLAALELVTKASIKKPDKIEKYISSIVKSMTLYDEESTKKYADIFTSLSKVSPKLALQILKKTVASKNENVTKNSLRIINAVSKKKPRLASNLIKDISLMFESGNEEIYHEIANTLIIISKGNEEKIGRKISLIIKNSVNYNGSAKIELMKVGSEIAKTNPSSLKNAIPRLSKELNSQRWEIREEAANLIGAIGEDNVELVKESIPGLDKLKNDGDDLVRNAAVRALESINVNALESVKIMKGADALESAKSVLKTARKMKLDIKEPLVFLKKAKTAFKEGKYKECVEFSKKAEKLARSVEDEGAQVRTHIETVKIKIKNARREGVGVAAAIKNLKEARVLLNKREFSEAKTKADDALKAVKSTVKGARPDLVIKAKTKESIKPEIWSKIEFKLANLGNAVAQEISVNFSDDFVIRGTTIIDILESGEELDLEIELYPKSKGLIPLTVELMYRSFKGKSYSVDKQDIVEVTDSGDFESRDLFVSGVGATVIAEEVPISEEVYKFDAFSIVCENCNARVPSNFRICGKCGFRLRKSRRSQFLASNNCSNCGNQLNEEQKFCGSCGQTTKNDNAVKSCNSCGSDLTPGQKFCGKCGTTIIRR